MDRLISKNFDESSYALKTVLNKIKTFKNNRQYSKAMKRLNFFLSKQKDQAYFKSQLLDPKKFSEKEFSNLKIGWLSNMNDKYIIEKSILDICEKKLKDLEKNNLEIEYLKPNLDTDTLWNSWTTFRSKSIYQDTLSMGIKDIDSMTFQAIWEYNKGKDIKSDNLKLAFEQKKRCTEQVNEIFDKFDFLALPSAQLFPFDKSIQFPSKINETSLDTYHRWLEVFIISSLLELPTITIPVGFNENGLPMGMQIIGKNKDDLKLFAFAKIFEEIYNNSNHKPKLN